MMLMATSVWAGGTVTVTKKLNGTVNDNAGTVTPAIEDGVCTLTVTPASGNYVTSANITAERIVDAGLAQGRMRAPSMGDNAIDVEAIDETNPAGTTTYSFAMPEDENYDVEVTVNFQSRTDISAGTLTLSLPQTGYSYDGQAKKPAVTVMLGDVELASTNYVVSYRDSVNAGQATVEVTGIKTYMGSLTEHFTIEKATRASLSVSINDWTYGDNPNAPTVAGNTDEPGTESIFYKEQDAADDTYTGNVPTNAGNYIVKVEVTATDNYAASSAIKAFKINKAALGDNVLVSIDSWTYGDTPKQPSVVNLPEVADVTYTYLIDVNDEWVESEDVPTNAGRYGVKATVGESTNYTGGELTGYFDIFQADFSQVVIDDIDEQVYAEGEEIKPAVTVTFKGNPVDASEFTATYSNNTNVGEATVTLTTKNVNFAAGQTNPSKTFQIVAAQAVITAEDQTETYNGEEQAFTNYTVSKGSVAIAYYASEDERDKGSNALETNPVDAGTYYVKLTQADDNYTSDAVTATFTIEPKSIEGMLWSEAEDELVYDGQAKTLDSASFGLYDNDLESDLSLDEDYTVNYTNNINVGTATITIEGIGNYQGTETMSFAIVRDLDLNFGADGMNSFATYCAAEDLETPEGLQAYVVTAVNGNTVETAPINYIPQGVPVLLEKYESYYGEYAYAYDGQPTTIEVNLLQGCATATSVASLANESTDIYVLYNDEFVRTISGTIAAFRCYLPVAKSLNAGARLGIFVDNEDTGISSVSCDNAAVQGKVFNLNGLRVMNPAKGLYIMNGKKVVVK